MMQSLENKEAEKQPTVSLSKQEIAVEIEQLIEEHHLSVLEAVTWWMEERSIPESQFSRFIPEPVIEQLKAEVIEDRVLKPSITKENTHSSLDFLYG